MAAKRSNTPAGLAISNCEVEIAVSTAEVSDDLFFHSFNSFRQFSEPVQPEHQEKIRKREIL